MILALSTAQTEHELALLSSPSSGPSHLLAERRWQNTREDVEKLVPTLQELLEEAAARKEDLTDLVVVRGPGSFTSLRVGIAFINALHQGLPQTRLHSLTTFDLLALKAQTADPLLVVLPAGGLDVALELFHENSLNKPLIEAKSVPGNTLKSASFQVGPLAPLLAALPHDSTFRVAAELPETLHDELRAIALEKSWHLLESHELLTLGQALQMASLTLLTQHEEPVTPLYLKSANITVSKDPWKRVK